MLRRILAALVVCLALLAGSAGAQSIPTVHFGQLPGSPAPGQLSYIDDGSGTATAGSPAAGGGANLDLVAYDATQTRWEFIVRIPVTAPPGALETYLEAIRVSYDRTTSGASAENVQAALDELFAQNAGSAVGGTGTRASRPVNGATVAIYLVTDCADSTCAAGGGSTKVLQYWNGSAWANVAQAAVATDLAQGTRTSTTVPITSSTGQAATLAAATSSLAGVMSAADKVKLDGVPYNGAVNLTASPGSASVTVNSSTGSGAVLPAATGALAGVMTAADKAKLDGISGAGATNLSVSTTPTSATVESDTGTDGVIPAATGFKAGLLAAADWIQLGVLKLQQADDTFYCENYSGSDIGAKCNAARADIIDLGAGIHGAKLVVGTGTFTQSTPIRLCDASGAGNHVPIELVGQGIGTSRSPTILAAGPSLRKAAVVRTSFSASANTGAGGRDVFTCVGCNFTASLARGDLVETSGFANAANNQSRSTGKMPLIVYRAEATTLTVEAESGTNAGLATESAIAATIQPLVAQVETCNQGQHVRGLEFDGGSAENSDFGILHRPDASPADGCIAAGQPQAFCTGLGTANGSQNVAICVDCTVDHVKTYRQKYAGIALTAPETSGQADNYRISSSLLWDSPVGAWLDLEQAKPAPLIESTDIHNYYRNGVRLTQGSATLFSNTIISGDSRCDADTYGSCRAVEMLYLNAISLTAHANAIEVKAGDGIILGAGSGSPRTVSLRDNVIALNDSDANASVLLDSADLCGSLVDDGNWWYTYTGQTTTAPSLTIGNSHQSTCPLFISGRSILSANTGGPRVPIRTINDGVPTTLAKDELAASLGNPNSGGLVHWSQLVGVPGGFADGSDDGSGGATDLSGLTDVTITSAPTGAVLVKSAGDWVNGAINLASATAVSGILADANVDNGITASNYLPLAGGTMSAGTTTIPTGATVTTSGSGVIRATAVAGSGSTTDAVDLATAEAAGTLPASKGGTGVGSLGTGVATALGVNTGSAGAFGVLVASGTRSLSTAAIGSGACSSADVGVSAPGVAATDAITWTPNSDLSSVVGYRPLSSDGLAIYPYPTANAINLKVCNPTANSITPGAVTINWRVIR